MRSLESLFRLEIEFYRRVRVLCPGAANTAGLHTSYALQSGYESLIREVGSVTSQDVERLHHRLMVAADTRDILAARNSLRNVLGPSLLDP
jgi:hypothetical protein